MSGMSNPSSMNTPSPAQSGQGQQGGIPLGSSYNAPANMSAPTAPQQPANLTQPSAPAVQVQQGGNQIAQQSGQGQQGGIPLGSSYNAPSSTPQPGTTSVPSGVTYNDSDNPYGPLSGMAWAAGLAIAAVMSGIGVWAAVKRR